MANALDAVLQMRKEKLLREQQAAESIKSGVDSFTSNFLAAKKQREGGSLTDQLITLGKVHDAAKTAKNLPLMQKTQAAMASLTGTNPNANPGTFTQPVQPATPVQPVGAQPSPATPQQPQLNSSGIPATVVDPFSDKQDPANKIQQDLAKKGLELEQETMQKVGNSMRVADRNVTLVTGLMHDFADLWTNSLEEGGTGNLAKKTLSSLAVGVGGEFGDLFEATGALPGKRTEIVAKMMPLLTQQGDKEGSVRLVATVFDKLVKTIPNDVVGPRVGRRQMDETMRNMFRFASAIRQLDITNESVEGMDKKQLSELGNRIEAISRTIEYSEEEQASIDNVVATALEPTWQVIKFDSVEEAENDTKLPPGTWVSIGGKKARLG